MALDQLLSVLLREAETEATTVQAAAQAEAQALRDRAAADLAARRAEDSRAWESERQHAMAVTLASARRAAREEELLARDRLLARVLARARRLLPGALTRSDFGAALPVQLAEALECLGSRSGTIRCSPQLGERIHELCRQTPGLELAFDPGIGSGFVLHSGDGALVIDATLEQQLTQLGPRLRQEILARLEGKP